MLDGKDSSLDILRGLRMQELRVPVLTSPAALSFRPEEWGRAMERLGEGELESGTNVCRSG